MKISYKREMKHNYMILEPEEIFYDSFEVHMMIANCIEGLLKFHVKQVDEKKFYYYEITSRQPLSRLLETSYLDAGKLYHLIMGIARTLDHMEAYLLGEGQILLEPEYIYVEPGEFEISLCLVPGLQRDFPEGLSKLLQYLLGRVDHQDKECVVMAYGLYQESLKDNYGMEDLLRLVGRNFQADRPPHDCNALNDEDDGYQCVQEDTDYTVKRQGAEIQPKDVVTTEQKAPARLKRYGGLAAAVVFGIPFAVWIFQGIEGVKKFRYMLLLFDGAVILGGVVLGAISHRKSYTDEWTTDSGRQVEFRQPVGTSQPAEIDQPVCSGSLSRREAAPFGNRRPAAEPVSPWQMEFANDPEPLFDIEQEPDNNTILLTGINEEEGTRRLRSIDHSQEDIQLSYFPYLIGKQEGLVDYVLAKDGVSRLHVRIDRDGEDYRITDLNSTNGTTVAGKHLESNETALLCSEDEVYIANIGFVFT